MGSSPPSGARTQPAALFDEAAGSARLSISFAEIRLSDAIAYAWPPLDEDGSDASAEKTPRDRASAPTTISAGEELSEPLHPTYFGSLETKKDALLLVERCLRGDFGLFRGPQHTTSAVRAGCVFIWVQDNSAFQDWEDGLSWDPIEHDGDFWISRQATVGDGFFRKTLSVPALGRFYHIVAYEDPWKIVDGTLKAPSEDPNLQNIQLRDELTSQLTADSEATKDCRYPRAILKACSPLTHSMFVRKALLLCLCFADEAYYEHLLRRNRRDWFPRIPFGHPYWDELSHKDLFMGASRRELRTQMKLLLLRLIEFAKGSIPSRLLCNQPYGTFSAMQNRALYGEIFRISNNAPLSPRAADPAVLSVHLTRSALFDQSPKLTPILVDNWIAGLMQRLPIDPPVHGDVSPCLFGLLEQVPIQDNEAIRMISMVHSCQFSSFWRTSNSQSLFLVACRSTSISTTCTELLHAWAVSDDGTDVYRRLLKILQDPLPPEELMLHLEALVLLYNMSTSTERDDMQSPQGVCLSDLDLLLKGHSNVRKSHAILGEMVWSFSRAILSTMSPEMRTPFLRFLDPARTAFSTMEQSPDMYVDRYMIKRIQDSSSHAAANSVLAAVKSPSKHAERDEDEISNHNTISTYISEMPLVDRPGVEHRDHAGESGSSCLRWGAFLNALGLGSCGGQKAKS